MSLLSMLFKGIPGDESVYQSDFDGSGWSAPQLISQIVTGTHPVWVNYHDQTIFTAWRESTSPHRIFAARYDGPGEWSWFGPVPGSATGAAPSAASLSGGRLLLAWKSPGGASELHFALFDSQHWSAAALIPGAATSHAPAVADFENKVHLVWKGISGDHQIYHATYDGIHWSTPQPLPGANSTSQPALATFGNQLVMAWKGWEGNYGIYWSLLDPGSQWWTPPVRIGAFTSGTGPALLEFAGRLHLVWKGVDDDFSLFMANFDGAFWWGQHQIPGVASSSTPSLAEYDPAY